MMAYMKYHSDLRKMGLRWKVKRFEDAGDCLVQGTSRTNINKLPFFSASPPPQKMGTNRCVSSMEIRAIPSAFSAKEIQIFSCSQCSTPSTLASQCSTPSTSNGTVAETGRVTGTSQDTVARSDDHTALSHLPGMRWRPVFLVKAIRMLILRWEMFCWAFRVNFW